MTNLTSWLYVDLDIIADNIKAIKEYIGPVKLLAVVKADAYGHGIFPVASCAVENGADYLGVSSVEEGIFLRKKGIIAPVLIFNTILPEQAEDVVNFNLTSTICSIESVKAVDEAAKKCGKKARVHLKIDTGMGRFGILPKDAVEFTAKIYSGFNNIYLEGLYTHFSLASNEGNTRKQFNLFSSLINELKKKGIEIPLKHACNSTALLNYKDMHLDMVRSGNLVYGMCPTSKIKTKNPSQLYSKIVFLKTLPKGHHVGYGNKFTTKKTTTIAIIPFGYYEGLGLTVHQPSNAVDVLKYLLKHLLTALGIRKQDRIVTIKGVKCNILGKISMQNSIIDVTDIRDRVSIGDVAELNAPRINISSSVARVYHKENRIFTE